MDDLREKPRIREKPEFDLNEERDSKRLKREEEPNIPKEEINDCKMELPELPIDVWKIITDLVSLNDFLKLIRLNSRFSKLFRRIFDDKISSMFPELSRDKMKPESVKAMWNLRKSSPTCFRLEGRIGARLPWDKEIVILQELQGPNRLVNLRTRESIKLGDIIQQRKFSFYPAKKEMAILQPSEMRLSFYSLENGGFEFIRQIEFEGPEILEYYNDQKIIRVKYDNLYVHNPQNGKLVRSIKIPHSRVSCISEDVLKVFSAISFIGEHKSDTYQVNTSNGQIEKIKEFNYSLLSFASYFVDDNVVRIIGVVPGGAIDINLKEKTIKEYEDLRSYDYQTRKYIFKRGTEDVEQWIAIYCIDNPNICQATFRVKGHTEQETALYVNQKRQLINLPLYSLALYSSENFFILSSFNSIIILPSTIVK